MLDELPRAVFPRAGQRKGTASLTPECQRLNACSAKVFVQNAGGIVADDVLGPHDRKRCYRDAASKSFELGDTESVRAAWKDEDVGSRQEGRELCAVPEPDEMGFGEFSAELSFLRPFPDDHLRTR
jgi:hypothetical protein